MLDWLGGRFKFSVDRDFPKHFNSLRVIEEIPSSAVNLIQMLKDYDEAYHATGETSIVALARFARNVADTLVENKNPAMLYVCNNRGSSAFMLKKLIQGISEILAIGFGLPVDSDNDDAEQKRFRTQLYNRVRNSICYFVQTCRRIADENRSRMPRSFTILCRKKDFSEEPPNSAPYTTLNPLVDTAPLRYRPPAQDRRYLKRVPYREDRTPDAADSGLQRTKRAVVIRHE